MATECLTINIVGVSRDIEKLITGVIYVTRMMRKKY